MCRRAEPARQAYFNLVEPIMGYSRSIELAAAVKAAYYFRDGTPTCWIIEYLAERIMGEEVCVIGPLPQGECSGVKIAVEGAIVTRPEDVRDAIAIVGDLDSVGPPSLTLCTRRRPCLVHVHGDNYTSMVPSINGRWVLATSQAFCIPPVLGLGGFTDGDRAVIVGMVFGAKQVTLTGFDWERVFLEHKRPSGIAGEGPWKHTKLEVSKRVLKSVARALGYVWAGKWRLERLYNG